MKDPFFGRKRELGILERLLTSFPEEIVPRYIAIH